MILTNTSKFQRRVLLLIYPTVFLVQILRILGYNLNMVIHVPFLLLFIFFSFIKLKNIVIDPKLLYRHRFILIYLAYVILSIIWIFINNIPIGAYISNIKLFVIPILFYFWGSDETDVSDDFYKVLCISMSVCVIIGLVLYITTPPFFASYIYESKLNAGMVADWQDETDIMQASRFTGVFESSYAISYLGMATICIELGSMLNKRNFLSNYSYVFLFTNLIGIVLSMQRVAWALCFLYLIYFLISGYFVHNKAIKKLGSLLIIALITLIFVILSSPILTDRVDIIVSAITERSTQMDFRMAMNGRMNQYDGIDFFHIDKVFGNGLGSSGRYATLFFDLKGVADGEYIKQIMEFGYVGLLIFFSLISYSILKTYNNVKAFSIELTIVLYFIAAGVGHNSLNSYFYGYIFWFALGRMNNRAYKNSIINC